MIKLSHAFFMAYLHKDCDDLNRTRYRVRKYRGRNPTLHIGLIGFAKDFRTCAAWNDEDTDELFNIVRGGALPCPSVFQPPDYLPRYLFMLEK